jgi:KUP system potassium uptake protein
VQNLKHNKIIHSDVAILHFKTENVPRVPNFEKVETKKLGGGFFQIIAHHGFMEEPKINMILTLAHEQGSNFKLEEASYYLGREKLSISTDSVMGRVRSNFFNFYVTKFNGCRIVFWNTAGPDYRGWCTAPIVKPELQ